MASNNTFEVSEEVRKIIASLELLPVQQKKELILKIIDIAESNVRQNILGTRRFLEKMDSIKQVVLKAGIVEVSFRDFGKSEITTLFQILRDAYATQTKRYRRIASYILLAVYFGVTLSFFFFHLTSTSIKPLITSNIITITAWIVISLLYPIGYFLLNNICEVIFKPLNKYRFKLIINEYSIGLLLTLLISSFYFIESPTLENNFIVPYFYPFIIRTIEGILELNIGSLLTSFIGIIIVTLTTINSVVQILQFIRDVLEGRKDNRRQSTFSKINDIT